MSVRSYTKDDGLYREIYSSTLTQGDHKSDFPYSMSLIKYLRDSYQFNGTTFYGGMGLPTFPAVPPSAIARAQIDSLNKVYNKVRNSSFTGGVALAEGKETLRMIGSTIGNIAKSVSNLRRGNIVGAARAIGLNLGPTTIREVRNLHARDVASGVIRDTSKSASQAWLALQFGWEPLISDITSGAEALANVRFAPRKQTARASNRAAGPDLSGFKDSADYVSGNVRWHTEIIYQSGITIGLGAPYNDTLGSLGLDQPYSALWNVIPWSFLVDYVVPIGDYLSAKEAFNKLDVTSYTKWEKVHRRAIGRWTEESGQSGRPCVYSQVTFDRYVLPPNTAKDVPFPGIKPASDIFSVAHVSNAIALLRSAFK